MGEDHRRGTRSPWALSGEVLRGAGAYALAVGSVAAAALLRVALGLAFPNLPTYTAFYLPIIVSALLGGARAGLLATVVSALAADFFFVEPYWNVGFIHAGDAVGMALFLGTGVVVSLVGARLRATQFRLETEVQNARTHAQALRASEQRLATLADAIPQLAWIARPDGGAAWQNRRWYEYTGLTPQQVEGWGWQRIHDPDLLPAVVARWKASLATGKPFDMTVPLRGADGVFRPFLMRIVPFRDDHGRIVQWFGTATDIAEQKRTEDMLQRALAAQRDSEQRYRGTFENAAVGIAHLDADGRFLRVNQRLAQMIGAPREELIGRRVADFTHPDDREPDTSQFAALWRGEIATYSVEKRYLHRDGHVGWTHLTRSMQRDEAGRPQYVITAVQDISARKAAEEAQRDSEQRFRGTFENAAVGIAHLDAAGQFLRVNQWLARMLGARDEELIGQSVLDFTHPDDREPGASQLAALWRGEIAADTLEKRYFHRGGGVGWFQVTRSMQRDEAGRPQYVITIIQDISARKRAEADLRQREQELAELNRTLERRITRRTVELERRAAQLRHLNIELTQTEQRERRQLATMLHDGLQQLIVAAKMHLARMRAGIGAHLYPAAAEIDEILNQAIAASRSLTVELFPPVLHDRGLAPALHWLARHMQEKHKLTVRVLAGADAEPPTDDVRVLLFQAARELLFNVVKHAGVQEAMVALACQNGTLRLQVIDHGRGFDPDQMRHADQKDGGFGLFSVQQRLECLSGEVAVESAPGEGTRVTLTVPLAPPEPAEPPAASAAPQPAAGATDTPGRPSSAGQCSRDRDADTDKLQRLRLSVAPAPVSAAPAPRQPAAPGQRLRVLLADDHQIMRDGVAMLLRAHGDMEVVGEAADGEMAVDLARRLHPDVVVMDVTMPKLDGVEATGRIVREQPEVRVIGLSMHEREDVALALRRAGAAAYLPKAGAGEALIATIRRCHAELAEAGAR